MTYELRWLPGQATLADAHAVRRAVFIEEQDVPESLEMDGRDEEATHVVVYRVDERPELPVGTARLRYPEPEVAKPERVAVDRTHRGRGLGRRLMEALEDEARERGCERTTLHAQTAVEAFYRELGYETTSDVFEEADIPHVEMKKRL